MPQNISLMITFSLRLETRTTDPGVTPPEAPELEFASATIAARRFASADYIIHM